MPIPSASPLVKFTVSVLVFAAIVSGWATFQHYRATSVTLPDADHADDGCMLWFVGSSSIHRWTDLEKDMTPWSVHNRGINSATLTDIIPRFANINVRKEGRPRAIIVYAGENDIANGVPVRTVIRQLATLLDQRTRLMGDVPVLLLSMKPSPGRAANLPQQVLFNRAAQGLISHAQQVHYVDITTPLLTDGKLGDNYQPDSVHMNPQGYRIWAKAVRARLHAVLPAATLARCGPSG